MKKFSFEIIKKIDYVIILLAALIFAGVFIANVIIDNLPHRPATSHVTIIDSAESPEPVEEEKVHESFLGKIKDVYVFVEKAGALRSEELAESRMVAAKAYNSISKVRSESEVVNFIFARDGKEKKLVSGKSFFYKYSLAKDFAQNPADTDGFDFNIYAVINADTNADGVLDSADDIAIFVSDYDGENFRQVSSSVYTFESVAKNVFMYSECSEDEICYYEYDGNTKASKLVRKSTRIPEEKALNLNYWLY